MKSNIRYFFFAYVLLCINMVAFSQAPSIEWQKSLGGTAKDVIHSMVQTFDGGFVGAGITESTDGDVSGNHGFGDFWIVKIDSGGGILWQKCLGGTYDEEAYHIQQTLDSGFIVVGYTASDDGDVTGVHGFSYDYWVVKLDLTGNIQWQKCLGGTDDDFGNFVKQTRDGGYIICGDSFSHDGDVTGHHAIATEDYWVVKLNGIGGLEWQKSLGGTGDDIPLSIDQTADGGFVVGGATSSTVSGDITLRYDLTTSDEWIVKLDSGGALLQQKSFGGSGEDDAFDLKVTPDGGCIVFGFSSSNDHDVTGNHGGGDYWLTKLNSAGNIQWQKCYGGSDGEIGYSIQLTSDHGYILSGISGSMDGDVTGNHGGDYWVVKTDSVGTLQWQKALGGLWEELGYSVEQSRDGGFIVAGSSESADGDVTGHHGGVNCGGICIDGWIVKLSPASTGIAAPASAITDFTTYLTNNNLYLNFYANGNERNLPNGRQAQVQLLDITGRVLLQQGLAVTAGFNKQEVRVGELSAGVYMVRLVTEGGAVTKKLMVQ